MDTVERIMPDHREPSEWEQVSGIDSSFRLSIIAALRTKQLRNGSPARIKADQRWRKDTSIALEEVKQGLVRFTKTDGVT
jgi:DNA-directed RNA polymerase omega subunit